jgi:hypothetical protein
MQNISYNAFETINTTELSDLTSCKLTAYRNGILKANRDGAETISVEGKQIWNVPYDMKEPLIDVCKSYAVSGDLGGKTAYIVNGSGVSNAITTLYPILEVQVAAQGVAALVLNNGTEDWINIYSMEKTSEIVTVKSVAAKDGFPISIALSEDGRKLITSYVKADTESITCQVTFHNLGDVGQNFVSNLVLSQAFHEFVPKVEFISNDVVAVFLENGFWMYSMEEIPTELAKIVFEQRIQDIFYGEEYIGVVLESQGTQASKLFVYNLDGEKIVERDISFSYQSIVSGEDYIIFYDDESCHAMSTDGKLIFDDSFEIAINQLLTGPSYKEFLAITDIGMNTIEMIETKEE